jgi:uncharacterized protein YndB with AHSA1/START domain
MSTLSTSHATFTIERTLPATLPRVFEAWSNPVFKRSWFACHDDWQTVAYELEFRVGGRERNQVVLPNGPRHTFEAIYLDIVTDYRLIYAYDMSIDERRVSVSLATVVFEAVSGRRTKLTFTEQAAFLDGYTGEQDHERGTELLLDSLERSLSAIHAC